jgi:hypothetical protein
MESCMKIGSATHKELFCRSFIGSHQPYIPEDLSWPELDEESLRRLHGIPFWEEALSTEREAGAMVNAYAATVNDPLLREAIALQGWEETRHARLIQFVIQHYGMEVAERPTAPPPDNIEPAFVAFGYAECLDSFLTFGMFKLARQSGFLPESLFTIFDQVMAEEARHIVFFVNWIAYVQARRGRVAGALRGLPALWYYGRALRDLWGAIRHADESEESFVVTGASSFVDALTPDMVLTACLEENARRMSPFDHRLHQPRFIPRLASVALRSMKLLPRRKSQASEH